MGNRSFNKILAVFLSLGTAGLFASSLKDGLALVRKEGKLKIAIDATYPPMEFEGADGKLQGFDIDVAEDLAKRIGVKSEFVVMNWDGILAGLHSERYDVIISSMNITPERQKKAKFVEYAKMAQVYVSRAKEVISKESELAGKVVAVQADTTSFTAVEAMKKRGIKIADIKAFSSATDVFSALKSKHADVVIIDEPVGRYYAKLDSSFVVTGQALAAEPIGIAMRTNETSLHREVEKQVAAMKSDGTFAKISKKWFGQELGI